ncbi:matrix metalloproteinase-9-like [Tubulanus polymorphus]|uniref:matrix metalloproteinase-9-like n=1 Tax=Tubulanus polymorphus TaxID=672921 RepID=UPI003DA59DF9
MYARYNRWGYCQAKKEAKWYESGPQVTVNGIPCVFPFYWKGKEYYECIRAGYADPWCSTTAKLQYSKMEKCKMANINRKTVDGKVCVFPFNFKGANYYNCVQFSEIRPWCYTDVAQRQIGFCTIE